jgi:hypothetical protein
LLLASITCTIVFFGCSKREAYLIGGNLSGGYMDKTSLARDAFSAIKNSDINKLESLVFADELSPENRQTLKDTWKADILALNAFLDVDHAQIARIEEHQNFSAFNRPEKWRQPSLFAETHTSYATEPNLIVKVVLSYPAKAKGTAQYRLTLPLVERGGKWWLCASLPATSPPPVKVVGLKQPLGVELSKLPDVSIVKIDENELGARGMTIGGPNPDLVTNIEADAIELTRLVAFIDSRSPNHKGQWFSGLRALPSGLYKIEEKNLPQNWPVLEGQLTTALEVSFDLKIIKKDMVWDGWLITPPAPLPPAFKKSGDTTNRSWSTVSEGYAFQGCVLDDMAEEIEAKLGMPVEFAHLNGNQRYDFTILCSFMDEDGLLYGLKELGFKIEPKKLTRQTTVIAPAK